MKTRPVSFTGVRKAVSRLPLMFVVSQTEANVYSRAVNHRNVGQILYRSRTRRQRESRTCGLAGKFGFSLQCGSRRAQRAPVPSHTSVTLHTHTH